MIEAMLRVMLGPLSPALDFIEKNPITVSAILLVWMLVLGAAYLQLQRIKKKTAELVIAVSRQEIAHKPNITYNGLFKRIYPQWEKELPTWGCWFIPHRLDLWPVAVKPSTVKAKIAFSPEWIKAVLSENHIDLEGNDNPSE